MARLRYSSPALAIPTRLVLEVKGGGVQDGIGEDRAAFKAWITGDGEGLAELQGWYTFLKAGE